MMSGNRRHKFVYKYHMPSMCKLNLFIFSHLSPQNFLWISMLGINHRFRLGSEQPPNVSEMNGFPSKPWLQQSDRHFGIILDTNPTLPFRGFSLYCSVTVKTHVTYICESVTTLRVCFNVLCFTWVHCLALCLSSKQMGSIVCLQKYSLEYANTG